MSQFPLFCYRKQLLTNLATAKQKNMRIERCRHISRTVLLLDQQHLCVFGLSDLIVRPQRLKQMMWCKVKISYPLVLYTCITALIGYVKLWKIIISYSIFVPQVVLCLII